MAGKSAQKINPKAEKERFSMDKGTDNNITIKVAVPSKEVEKVRNKVIEKLSKNVSVAGFRKGAAPANIAKNNISKDQIQEEILKDILTREYVEAVKNFGIKPIINPRVHIEMFEEGTDLKFTAETAEEPDVKLKNYKKNISGLNAKSKIVTSSKSAQSEKGPQKTSTEEIFSTLLAETEVVIPKVLIDQEANRLISQFVAELKKLGVTLDQYLSSQNKKGEDIRKEYEEKAKRDLKIEFALRKVADEEKITVEEKDVQEAINSVKDEAQKAELLKNPYLLATIIRQQKTITFLTNL